MSEIKSLVIKSKSAPQGARFEWSKIGNIETFTKEIITPAIGADGGANVGSVVSGMPTVFARANMFRIALDSVTDPDYSGSGLLSFYKFLISEWKGLISCMALNAQSIKVKRIYLTYSDGKTTEDTSNLYECTGSFGNMLFERKELWANPSDVENVPFVDVIIYKDQVIGGTSPDSFLFTSNSYNLAGDSSAYVQEQKTDAQTIGKLIDPLATQRLTPDELTKLKNYVKHILSNINAFENQYRTSDLVKPNYSNIVGNLENWLQEIDSYANEKGQKFESDVPPPINLFKAPFAALFNYSEELRGIDGVFSQTGDGEVFDPKDVLLDPTTCKIACVDDEGDPDFIKNKPILLLRATVKGEVNDFRHFTLPLSPLGIKIFGKHLGTCLGLDTKANTKTTIRGIYDIESQTVEIIITYIDQSGKKLNDDVTVYKVAPVDISGKDLLLWPNFISKKWNKYFLYSEMPHNSRNWQAKPFFGDANSEQFDFILNDSGDFKYLADNGVVDDELGTLKVEHSSKVGATRYEYEIYESKNPFRGLRLSHNDNMSGYAIIEYGNEHSSELQNKLSLSGELKEAHLGVDFGSTNTSIAYRDNENGSPVGFKFTNRRVSLLASDEKDNSIKPAGEDEVFFFQNDEIESNQIKSVLTIHDENRMSGNGSVAEKSSQYVTGGFPCFEKNLPIEDGTENRYLLNFGDQQGSIGQASLVHNMKWSNDPLEESYKKAYLKTLLLQVYSDLFAKGLYPKSLKWSYPSAMSNSLIGKYDNIWQGLKEVNPLSEDHNLRVSLGTVNLDYDTGSNTSWGASDSNDSWGAGSPAPQQNYANDGGWPSAADSSGSDSWGTGGDSSTQQGNSGWEDKNKPAPAQKAIVVSNDPLNFSFKEVDTNSALTESCAVANYLLTQNLQINGNALVLCFDIGGSTTDILALAKMKQGVCMVKQNSIRFAAQRVAHATKYSPNFQKVLKEVLDKKGVTIQGINRGQNQYSPNTAPYFFEQLVDRLDESEFDDFYRLLGANCPELVSVNLYITGLIMFYAGQLSNKIKLEIDKSKEKEDGFWSNPKIQIQFTGKGSRIMDWLKAINPQASEKYYMDMFIMGFGGNDLARQHLGGPPIMDPRKNENIKYEVSMGLAAENLSDKLYVSNTALEIIGEDGFKAKTQAGITEMKADDYITGDMMANLGSQFVHLPENPNTPCPKFMQFAHVYFQVATNVFGLKVTQQDFMKGFQSMNIESYIKQQKEYKEAQKSSSSDKPFDYVAPIIILEGMKFFEDVILKKIAVD